jgi:hypothetical protein
MKTRSWMLLVAAIVGVAAVGLGPASASAVAPAAIGWWTEAQQGAYTGGVGAPLNQAPNATDFHVGNAGCPAQAAPCSAVPTGITVGPAPPANAPAQFGPTAISAVLYALPNGGLPVGTDPGTVIAQLSLAVDGSPVDPSFRLLACRVLGAWSPIDGGDWSQRPSYQPGGCAVGVASPDGMTIGFTIVAALADRTNLDLALVPRSEDPTPFMVMLKSADANALTWKPLRPVVSTNYQPAPQSVEIPPASLGLPPDLGNQAAPPPGPAPGGNQPVKVPGVVASPQVTAAVADLRIILLLLAALLVFFASNWSARARRLLAPERDSSRGVGRFVGLRRANPRPL